jgi:hypothetical protein
MSRPYGATSCDRTVDEAAEHGKFGLALDQQIPGRILPATAGPNVVVASPVRVIADAPRAMTQPCCFQSGRRAMVTVRRRAAGRAERRYRWGTWGLATVAHS